MEAENDYSSIGAQLGDLLNDRVVAEMEYEHNMLDQIEAGMGDLRNRRRAFWDSLLRHHDDTRQFARAILQHHPAPLELTEQEATAIEPPCYRSTHHDIERLAQQLAPPEINGRPNKLARRVQNG